MGGVMDLRSGSGLGNRSGDSDRSRLVGSMALVGGLELFAESFRETFCEGKPREQEMRFWEC